MLQLNIHICHIFREMNQLADFIANIAIEQEHKIHHHNFNQLSSNERKILHIDKMQIPSMRVSTRKIRNTYNQAWGRE